MNHIKNLQKLLKFKSNNIDELNNYFKLLSLKRNNIKVNCIITGKKLPVNGYSLKKIKRKGTTDEPCIYYFFENGEYSFYIVVTSLFFDKLLFCNYYLKKDKYFSFRPRKDYNKYINYFKNIPEIIKIKNKCLIGINFGNSKWLDNPLHYQWEISFILANLNKFKSIKLTNDKNFLSNDKLNLYKYLKDVLNIKVVPVAQGKKFYKLENFRKINGIPFSISGGKTKEFIDYKFIDNFNKVVSYNNTFLPERNLFDNLKNKYLIYIHLKNNGRRISPNYFDFVLKLLSNLIDKFNDKCLFIFGGSYNSINGELEKLDVNNLKGEQYLNYENYKKIKKFINEKYPMFNNNCISVIGYGFLDILKYVNKLDVIITRDTAGINDYISLLSPDCLYFDFGTLTGQYKNDGNYLLSSEEMSDWIRCYTRKKDLRKNMYIFWWTIKENKESKWNYYFIPNIEYVVNFITDKITNI